MGKNLLAIDEVVFNRSPVGLVGVLGDAGAKMALAEAAAGELEVDVDEPPFVEKSGGVAPEGLIQSEVVTLEEKDAMGGQDRDVVFLGILDGVVKGGGPYGLGTGGCTQGSNEGEELGSIEGEGGAAPGVGLDGIRHG